MVVLFFTVYKSNRGGGSLRITLNHWVVFFVEECAKKDWDMQQYGYANS